jgi:hypothetical protein
MGGVFEIPIIIIMNVNSNVELRFSNLSIKYSVC